MFDLSGMTALVTGASGGIGSAIAKGLAAQGARLAVSGSNVAKLEEYRAELGGDHVAFGYLTTTITVSDVDPAAADEKVRAVERVVNGLGFTVKRERMNAVEAWLSSLPGQVYANVRQPLVHTLNLAHLMPLSSVWAGPAANSKGGPPR